MCLRKKYLPGTRAFPVVYLWWLIALTFHRTSNRTTTLTTNAFSFQKTSVGRGRIPQRHEHVNLPWFRQVPGGGYKCSVKITAGWQRCPTALKLRYDGKFPHDKLINDNEDDDNYEDDSSGGHVRGAEKEGEQDWRAFRAKLVMQERNQDKQQRHAKEEQVWEDGLITQGSKHSERNFNKDDNNKHVNDIRLHQQNRQSSSLWAYEAGDMLENGSLLLTRLHAHFGHGLGPQYLHKCIVLVTHHDTNECTTGLILNRPTGFILTHDNNIVQETAVHNNHGDEHDYKWRLWFGGDTDGINSHEPCFYCLHSLQSNAATTVSQQIMDDVQLTNLRNARMLVNSGIAKPKDFWVFCGFTCWKQDQMIEELDDKMWYTVATDLRPMLTKIQSQALLLGLEESGLSAWNWLMDMIGKEHEIRPKSDNGDFDDLMLKEWVKEKLIFCNEENGENDDAFYCLGQQIPDNIVFNPDDSESSSTTTKEDATQFGSVSLKGSLIRASWSSYPPSFLLSDQEFHKSLILIIQDDENFSIGVLLNRPSAKTTDLEFVDDRSFFAETAGRTVQIPLRFGGPFDVIGTSDMPLFFLHCSEFLREKKIGESIGDHFGGIWRCTMEQAADALKRHLAVPDDFMAVNGVCLWPKSEGGKEGGILEEIQRGRFEVVPLDKIDQVWDVLMSQKLLSTATIDRVLKISDSAWSSAGCTPEVTFRSKNGSRYSSRAKHGGEKVSRKECDSGFLRDDISSLADDALKKWVATFLLGDPGLHGN